MTQISDKSKLEYIKEKIERRIEFFAQITETYPHDVYAQGQLSAYTEMLKTFEDMGE